MLSSTRSGNSEVLDLESNYWLVSKGECRTLLAMELWADLRFVWQRFVKTLKGGWLLWIGRVLTFMVLTGLVLFPNDLRLLDWVQAAEGWKGAEKFFGFWGDFLQFSVGGGILLLIAGALRKDRWLRRAAFAFILAGVLSGVTTRVFKMTSGRARPETVVWKELHYLTFTGPTTSGKFHGYFSGHTSAAAASAVAIAVIYPRVGWVVLFFAGAVGWSRMYGNHHFPADVAHGAAWGVMWGFLVGTGLKEAKDVEQAAENEPEVESGDRVF